MEILTLLKANIRRKKGSFVSVILLTFIVSMCVTTILSIKESALKGVVYAHELCDTPDLTVLYMSHRLSDDMLENVKNHESVKAVNTVDSIIAQNAKMGDEEYRQTMVMFKADESIRILKEDLSGIAEEAPVLQKGEIYVPLGFLTLLKGEVGQKIIIRTIAGEYEFTVKGSLLEPKIGSAMIGWKLFCISEEDYNEIYPAVANAETEDSHGFGAILEIKKSDDCGLSDGQFRRQLNLDTDVTNMALGSLSKDMSINYTTLFVNIISSILLVFVILLLVIVTIVTVHSISVEIETDYATFGVLKAQGFDKNKIRLLFLGRYMLAEVIGVALGIVLSIPLINLTSNIFVSITSIPSLMSIPIGAIALIIAALFLLSAASVFFITKKVNRISPVRAISGAKKEIYFDSRINAPISKKLLSPSLAFRQFTSAKRRYIGALLIVTILVFFMTAITLLANIINSKSALESMGVNMWEIIVSPNEELSEADFEKIEEEIERFAEIKRAGYISNAYFSFEGEEMMCAVYKDPSQLPAIKGRTPAYDNEIAVSPILLDEFQLEIGDEVTVGWHDKKDKFLIVGTVQFMNDAGRCFLISYEAAQKIGFNYKLMGTYSLVNGDDEELNEKIAASLKEKFGDIIGTVEANSDPLDSSIKIAVEAVQLLIYVFSVLFSLIVVQMVCSKAFAQEQTDIGIYKAIGFGTSNLRLQFALRFLIVSVIGAALGVILSYFFSGKMLEVLLRSMGVTNINTNALFYSFLIPVVIICVSFMLFSYLASGKVRKVKIRELVIE